MHPLWCGCGGTGVGPKIGREEGTWASRDVHCTMSTNTAAVVYQSTAAELCQRESTHNHVNKQECDSAQWDTKGAAAASTELRWQRQHDVTTPLCHHDGTHCRRSSPQAV
jgi:hypothetical protein